MNTTTLAVGAVVLAALAATGCGATAAPDRAAKTDACPVAGFASPYQHIDPCSAEDVLHAAVTAIFDYRPAEDPDPRAAFVRARPLLQARLAAQAEHAAGVWAPITTSQWHRWRQQQVPVTARATVTGDDHPADTNETVDRVLAVSLSVGDTPVAEFAVYASAERDVGGPWLLSGLGVRS
ncbi:hypothetical protein ACFWPH_32880 [Nocardia sp. NPDC058499]|uniref:hypothetical protein n=1 Tax=Nocardia sp. NPDC058499 TaxID=3346530 RepID=UPI00365BC804